MAGCDAASCEPPSANPSLNLTTLTSPQPILPASRSPLRLVNHPGLNRPSLSCQCIASQLFPSTDPVCIHQSPSLHRSPANCLDPSSCMPTHLPPTCLGQCFDALLMLGELGGGGMIGWLALFSLASREITRMLLAESHCSFGRAADGRLGYARQVASCLAATREILSAWIW